VTVAIAATDFVNTLTVVASAYVAVWNLTTMNLPFSFPSDRFSVEVDCAYTLDSRTG